MTPAAPTEEIRETRLANGIRIVTERMPEARSVSLGVWVGVGGRDEPDALAGASHFLEHLLFKGTSTRSARQIAEAIDAVGGEMNAFTNREHTAYYTRLPADRADLGLDILGDVLTDPAFRPHEVDAERQVILEEILMNLDMPEDHVHTLLAEALFPGHPLGREVLGTRETVEAATRDQIADFFGHWYLPRNLVVVAAGDLDHDRVVDAFGGIARPARRAASGPSAPRPTRRVEPRAVLDDPTEQVHVAMGWRGVDHYDDDRYALVGRQPDPGRRHVEPPVPGGPRGAGPVLLGLLVGARPTPTRAAPASTPAPPRPGSASCSAWSTTRSPSWSPRA